MLCVVHMLYTLASFALRDFDLERENTRSPSMLIALAGRVGLEPTDSCSKGKRFYRRNYLPIYFSTASAFSTRVDHTFA